MKRLRSRTPRHRHQLVGQQITLPCQSQQEIHNLLHAKGLKALRIAGRPGAWHCDISGTPAALELLDCETVAALRVAPYQASPLTQANGAMRTSRPTLRPTQNPRQATNFNTRLATLILSFPYLWNALTSRYATRGLKKRIYKMKQTIKNAAVGTLAALASAVTANALVFDTDVPVAGSNYNLNIGALNDDIGAVYNSATTTVFQNMAQDLFALGNHSYSTVDEMVNAEFSPSINPASTVDNFNGWSTTSQNNGEISLTNNGDEFLGQPSYTVWDTDANSSYMSLTAPVSTSLLETNGTAGNQAFTLADVTNASWDANNFDAIIVRTDNDMLNLGNYTGSVPYNNIATFTGTGSSGFNSWSDDAPSYAVLKSSDFGIIPEPSSFGLLGGLAALGYVMSNNRRKE